MFAVSFLTDTVGQAATGCSRLLTPKAVKHRPIRGTHVCTTAQALSVFEEVGTGLS